MSKVKAKGQENVHSSLLSSQENERLLDLMGKRCVSMATAVVQLYMALPHDPLTWSFQHTGILCFVKDNPRRSYFIRLFDLQAEKMIWEQELYNQMTYSCPTMFFHSFAADDCQVGLNFANDTEARSFRSIVEEKISQKSARPDKKQQATANEKQILPPTPPQNGPAPQQNLMATVDIQNPDIVASRYRSPTLPTPTPASITIGKKDKKGKKKGPRLTKADIGAPSGFTHVTHIGWDPNSGFDTNNLDPDLKKLFSSAGISNAELEDKETSKLIYKFIEESGGLDVVKEEMRKHDASRSLAPAPGGQRSAPVPPPPRGSLPPVPGPPARPPPPAGPHGPPPLPGGRSGPPPPPPPNQAHKPPPPSMGGGPPPPPPPPAPSALNFPSSPSSSAPPPVPSSGGRGTLMEEIRRGRTLKTVAESMDPQSPHDEPSEGIVGALMMVMQKRSKVIHSSEDEDEDGGDEDDDEEWDD